MAQLKITADYLDDLMVRMAHHSTAIEGNTLTLGETKSILIDGYIPRAMDMRELYEVQNYRSLMPFLVTALQSGTPITLDFIRDIHRLLCTNAIDTAAGEFKKIPNLVLGADFTPTPPYMVPTALEDWRLDLAAQLSAATDAAAKITAICQQHITFEHIHPFADGNGRTGRALMVYSALASGLPPINIPVTERKKYLAYMNNSDATGLATFAHELMTAELPRLAATQMGDAIIYITDDI